MDINWIADVFVPLISAFIGGIFALFSVVATLRHEKKELKLERIEKAKPIVINYMPNAIENKNTTPRYTFVSDGEDIGEQIIGIFKNTDNGLLFLDKISTEVKTYYPKNNNFVVDKNTAFVVILSNLSKENLKSCKIYCHDIFGTQYYYDAEFCFNGSSASEIIIGNIKFDKNSRKKCHWRCKNAGNFR